MNIKFGQPRPPAPTVAQPKSAQQMPTFGPVSSKDQAVEVEAADRYSAGTHEGCKHQAIDHTHVKLTVRGERRSPWSPPILHRGVNFDPHNPPKPTKITRKGAR